MGTPWQEFRGDFGSAAAAWRAAPLLPFVSLLVTLPIYVVPRDADAYWAVLPFQLLWIGWVGTERIWYLRVFRRESITAGEAQDFTLAFFGRFVALGLIVVVASLPLVGIAVIARDAIDLAITSLYTVATDLALTFVTPALAFSTTRASEALQLGWRMLHQEWPRTAWYGLVPPLAVVVLSRLWAPEADFSVRLVAGVLGISLNLLFKGATAAFYLRRVDVGRDGAAFLRRAKRS